MSLPRGTRRSYVNAQYPAWVNRNRLRTGDMRRLRNEADDFGYWPLMSVVVPVYNPEPEWLRRALDSVMRQVYPNWELCICDDASTRDEVHGVLSSYEQLDGRIKVAYLPENSGISAVSNRAISLAKGEFIVLLDHDDELPPEALFEVLKLLQERPEADLIYSDVDKIDESGKRSGPNFKPGWSPELLLSSNYISHLGVFRRSIVEEIGGFRSEFDGCQDYDLTLRFTERTDRVYHVPKILYHWRMVEGSLALSNSNKDYIKEAARRALSEALRRRGIEGFVEDGLLPNRFRVKPEIQGNPTVSIIIPTRDNLPLLRRCLESVECETSYPEYEVIIVDNASTDPATVEYLASTPHRVIEFREDFNFSRINNLAANAAEGEYLLFLNDDTEIVSGEWLEEMLRHTQKEGVGAVGAKLLYPDGTLQHAGVLTGVGHSWVPAVATHSLQHYPATAPGYYVGMANTIRNYSAVTAACMMVRKKVFEEVGGFDEMNLGVAYNDVDLCLKMRERGYRIVYTPYAELIHHESISRGGGGTSAEAIYMRKRWGEVLDGDSYYNPNFSLGEEDFEIRADMLRPKVLRMDTDPPSGSIESRLMDSETFREYLEAQQYNARSSRRHALRPRQSP